MSQQKGRVLIGIGVILLGLFFLLNNFRVFGDIEEIMVAGGFAVGGFIFLSFYLRNQRLWGLLFPAFVLLGISGLIFVDSTHIFSPYLEEASIFLFALSLPFWIIFMKEKNHWWAAIPAGVLTSLAFFITVENVAHSDVGVPILFTGFALTFWLLWLIRRDSPTHWAIWPAMGLSLFTLFFLMVANLDQLWPFWPLILIAVGGWLLLKNRPGQRQTKVVAANNAPATSTNGEENTA